MGPRRVIGYDAWLSKTARRLRPDASVWRVENRESTDYILRFGGVDAVNLGTSFKRARASMFALIHAQERKPKPDYPDAPVPA